MGSNTYKQEKQHPLGLHRLRWQKNSVKKSLTPFETQTITNLNSYFKTFKTPLLFTPYDFSELAVGAPFLI
jgi:hypothetical protein